MEPYAIRYTSVPFQALVWPSMAVLCLGAMLLSVSQVSLALPRSKGRTYGHVRRAFASTPLKGRRKDIVCQ